MLAVEQMVLEKNEMLRNDRINEGIIQVAKEIIKKHDIIKMFLVDILEVDEKDAEEEAKSMKYAMSPDTTKKLEKYISKIMDLGDLDCEYDKNNPKCKILSYTKSNYKDNYLKSKKSI